MNYLLFILLSFLSCKTETPTQFSEVALADTFTTLDGNSIVFKDIIEAHKGQTILIDVWASWCRDCIEGMPKVKTLQRKYKDVAFVFLSLDKTENAWKKGIKKYDVQGEHFFMQSGWDGAFGKFLDLDWIPRYLVIDKQGNIKLFKAVKANDKRIKQNLINN
ncbi:TlpA family protein disulfide reductase [Flaviramulus sp. BrNp1-15]|uniref:TlpA family protein disulfide reductase n=1 Tax=Flaviramulus sp. BrNp1-15 TaxID=2916754 RepID=UPI001EE95C0A|nr:TlpA disulfide reductase family protein [Flaviramulus sp. BrNp1-15]ULC58811.1 TlpA family protein disulfide reductase [Flaviramulus sp. BrNp1-15]